MKAPEGRGRGSIWPFAVFGALAASGLLYANVAGDYEGADALVVAGPAVAAVGALVGAAAGALVSTLGARSHTDGPPEDD
jgi:hypothetical protein